MKPASESKADKPQNAQSETTCRTRELFGPDEHCYVMDAKSNGNIGRYLNVF